MRRLAAVLLLAVVATPGDAMAQDFSFLPSGDLPAGSGQGRSDDMAYAPTMLFPMQQLPAFANSQVWGHGGSQGPGGGQCDMENYSYPWRDNYCESRSWDMPLCPAGTGHQGQDIRAATCDKDVHVVVAGENGTITNVGSYSVYVTADDGTRFDYLHMSNVQVSVGQEVQRGDQLGTVSNVFGGTPTTVHLHFNIRQNVMGVGTVYVPPYMSLINAYQKLIDRPVDGALEAVGCDAMVGWAYDPDEPESPVDVPFVFDASGVAYDVRADVYRDDLCENLSFCDHGFDMPPPYSLFDGASHDVDATNDVASLPGSPLAMECEPPVLDGGRRAVSEEIYAAWGFTAFWDEPPVEVADVEVLEEGKAFPQSPQLWKIDRAFFVVDDGLGVLRAISARGISAWRLSAADAEVHEGGEMEIGEDWPERPLVVRDAADEAYIVDLPVESSSGASGVGGSTGTGVEIDDEVAGGCGCETAGSRSAMGWGWLSLIAAMAWRRRERRR